MPGALWLAFLLPILLDLSFIFNFLNSTVYYHLKTVDLQRGEEEYDAVLRLLPPKITGVALAYCVSG